MSVTITGIQGVIKEVHWQTFLMEPPNLEAWGVGTSSTLQPNCIRCGDGRLRNDEECDDGNDDPEDTCRECVVISEEQLEEERAERKRKEAQARALMIFPIVISLFNIVSSLVSLMPSMSVILASLTLQICRIMMLLGPPSSEMQSDSMSYASAFASLSFEF